MTHASFDGETTAEHEHTSDLDALWADDRAVLLHDAETRAALQTEH